MQPAIPVKGPYIKIIHRCERQKRYGGWTPAFRLFINDGNSLRLLPGFSARSPLLTLPTRAAAERWSERQAREWCRKNYPGWPVQFGRAFRHRTARRAG